MITQLSFLPDTDNDHERVIARPSVPLVKLIGEKWCWLISGTNEYRHDPELELLLLAAQARRARREAA